jgi:hypothetical protein
MLEIFADRRPTSYDRSAEVFIGLYKGPGKLNKHNDAQLERPKAGFYNESKDVMRFKVVKGSK